MGIQSGADLSLTIVWASVIALTLGSAFFSACEAALFSLGQARLAEMEEQDQPSSERVKKLLELPGRLVVTLTLFNDSINVAIVILAALLAKSYALDQFHPWLAWRHADLALSMGLSFLLILLLGQTLPKFAGALGASAVARRFATPLEIFIRIAYPFRVLIRTAAETLMKAFGAAPSNLDALEQDSIRELIETGSRQGVLDVIERELLANLLRSGEVTASEIMTPRHEVVGIPLSSTLGEALSLIKEEDYSRFPVYDGDLEHIVGMITARDLLKLRLLEDKSMAVEKVMRKPLATPEQRKASDLLIDFRKSRQHMSLVVDEFGSVVGIVTLEDVLEEIFGEVNESGEEPDIVNIGDNHWRAKGGLELSDFNAITGALIPGRPVQTLAGLVLTRLGRRPRKGDKVKVDGFKFEVLETSGIIIERLEIKREAGK